MNITCPKSNRHKRFSVTAHIVQEWEVGPDGQFTKVITDCTDVTHQPAQDDLFLCRTCGTQALVEDGNEE